MKPYAVRAQWVHCAHATVARLDISNSKIKRSAVSQWLNDKNFVARFECFLWLRPWFVVLVLIYAGPVNAAKAW